MYLHRRYNEIVVSIANQPKPGIGVSYIHTYDMIMIPAR